MTPPPFLTFRYLTRFACTAGLCPQNCCIGWKVQCDEEDYRKLATALATSPESAALFREQVRHDAPDTPLPYTLSCRKTACVFLDPAQLCALQRQFGPGLLPKVCALFPRTLTVYRGEASATASLACPEIARLLLQDPEAMTPVLLPASALTPAGVFPAPLDALPATPYRVPFHRIRATFFTLLERHEFPLSSRLFFATYFSHRTRPFFFAGQTRSVAQELARERERILDPALQAALHRQLQPVATPGALGMMLVRMVVQASRETQTESNLRQLIHTAAMGLAGNNDAGDMEALWLGFRRRGEELDRLLPGQLAGYLERFLKNKVYHLSYLQFDHLLAFWRELLLWTVLLRFLLIGALPFDPVVTPANAARDALDHHAVRLFSAFSRAVEHASPLLARVRLLLDRDGIDSFSHLVFFIRF